MDRGRQPGFNPLGPCGGHASPCQQLRLPGREDPRVSIPSAPAGGMQAAAAPPPTPTTARPFQSPRPLRGACKPRWTRPLLLCSPVRRFNPLGPCGGHASPMVAIHRPGLISACAFQSPRPLRGACKIKTGRSIERGACAARVSIPSAPAGGMQGQLVDPLPRAAPQWVSIPSAPAGGMQAPPDRRST